MNVCNYCGVELDVEMNFCPLCGHKSNTKTSNGVQNGQKTAFENGIETFNYEELTHRQKRKVVWELAAFVLLLTSVVTLIIDLLTSKHITWSKYTMTVGAVLLMDLSLILLMNRRIYLVLIGCFVSTSLLLFLIDLYAKTMDSGLTLGVPIIFFIFLVVFFLAIIVRKSKQKGINIIAYSLVAAGVICMCIEGIISLHIQNVLKLQWSLIVLVSVLPVSAFLLYVHYRLKRATNLKKVFHL